MTGDVRVFIEECEGKGKKVTTTDQIVGHSVGKGKQWTRLELFSLH